VSNLVELHPRAQTPIAKSKKKAENENESIVQSARSQSGDAKGRSNKAGRESRERKIELTRRSIDGRYIAEVAVRRAGKWKTRSSPTLPVMILFLDPEGNFDEPVFAIADKTNREVPRVWGKKL